MTQQALPEFRFPLSPEERKLRDAMVYEMLTARDKRNYAFYLENWPGVASLSGRERLAYYETVPGQTFLSIAQSDPRHAMYMLRDWLALWKRYRPDGNTASFNNLKPYMGATA